MYHCEGFDVSDVDTKIDCINKGLGYHWINQKYNFDNLGQVNLVLPELLAHSHDIVERVQFSLSRRYMRRHCHRHGRIIIAPWLPTTIDMLGLPSRTSYFSLFVLTVIFQVNVSRCLLKQRMEVVVKTGAISRAKLQSNHHHLQTNTQFFYRPDALPVAQPTVSKH